MGYSDEERVQVKLEFLRMLTRLELDSAKLKLITGFFETYLQLKEEEEKILKKEINKLDPEEEVRVMEIMTSWERKGIEKGLQQGRTEGKLEVVKRLLDMGMEIESIAKATGLDAKEIEKLK